MAVRIGLPFQLGLVPTDSTEEDLDGTECTDEEMEASFVTSLMDTWIHLGVSFTTRPMINHKEGRASTP